MLLLTDGTVMVQQVQASANSGSPWWKLTPDAYGSYANGTWTQLASMPAGYVPYETASAILPDGRVLVVGGEFNYANGDSGQPPSQNDTALGAIYDPVANTWTPVNPPAGWNEIGDSPSVVLANGTFMVGQNYSTSAALFNPSTLTWTPTGSGKNDIYAEEGMSLLPNGKVLTVDVSHDPNTELYDPSTGTWSSAGTTPVDIVNQSEVGPMLLRPNGTVFAAGGNQHNAVYDTATGTWQTTPQVPDWPVINGDQYVANDAPGAVLPDGKVLLAASYEGRNQHFFVFNGTNLNEVATDWPSPQNGTESAASTHMLVLPDGQVLVDNDQNLGTMYLYTDPKAPSPAWQPTITSFLNSMVRGESYRVTGTQLNGLTQGSAFGDDNQNATNYPIVRITTTATGHVFYARTSFTSSMSVTPGLQSYADFTVPPNAETGTSTMSVVANGIASAPVNVTIGPTPTINRVTIGGTVAQPTVTVTGSHFGSQAPSTAAGCGATGMDFAHIQFSDTTQSWNAGHTGNCIGLQVTTWTSSEIVFGFGNEYQVLPQFSLQNGDGFTMTVKTATYTGTVAYTAINRVTIGGTVAQPTVTVTGSDLGSQAPSTAAGCGATGMDFAHIQFSDTTQSWNAGHTGNCIGLQVTTWTSSEIVFGFGNFYGSNSAYQLNSGDQYSLDVLGTQATGTVGYSTITGVSVTGTATVPTITVTGSNLGAAPVGLAPGCGDWGEVFTGVRFVDITNGWDAGEPPDCLGLTVTLWTNTQVVFGFGSGYSSYNPTVNGDQFLVSLFGVTASGTVTTLFPYVVFGGTSTNPTVTVSGTNLPSEPIGTPAQCGGQDFSSVLFQDVTAGWAAGYGPDPQNMDQIGLIVSTWTPTEIVFTFGFCSNSHGPLNYGDAYTLNLTGLGREGGTVTYQTISNVAVSGPPIAPLVTVTGTGFGTTPPPGVPVCGAYTGFDNGSSLSFVDVTGNWGAGRGYPSDCIGITVTSWSDTQIVFGFGSFFIAGRYSVNTGDNYMLTVKGATKAGAV